MLSTFGSRLGSGPNCGSRDFHGLGQWFSHGSDFATQGTFGNVWEHFGCHNWGLLLASSG